MGRCWWKEAVLVCVWCWWMTSLEQQLIVTLSAEECQLLSGLERTRYRGGDRAVDLTVVSVNNRRSRDEVDQKTVPYLRPSKKRAESRCGVCCAVLLLRLCCGCFAARLHTHLAFRSEQLLFYLLQQHIPIRMLPQR